MSVDLERPVVIPCEGRGMLGILHGAPRVDAGAGVLIVVGGPQYRVGSHRQFVLLARDLAARGVPVLRFDYRGMGDSQGEFAGFEHIESDITAAIDFFMSALPDLKGVVMFGLCDAASAALMYRDLRRRVAGLILANPWVRTSQGEAKAVVRHYYAQRILSGAFWRKLMRRDVSLRKAALEFLHKVRLAASPWRQNDKQAFVDRMLFGLNAFGGPVLVVTSQHDLTAREFEELCKTSPQWRAAVKRSNVRAVSCAEADHTFSTERAHGLLVDYVTRWLESEGFVSSGVEPVRFHDSCEA